VGFWFSNKMQDSDERYVSVVQDNA
jgi:hypothetical protein